MDLQFGGLFSFELEDDDDEQSRIFKIGEPGQYGRDVASIKLSAAYSAAAESSPNGILYDDHDDTIYVANPGANVLTAHKDGLSRLVAYFASTETPTAITKGPDDFLYVCTTANPKSGTATIYRIDPRAANHKISVDDMWATDFEACSDVHYSLLNRAFYVVEQVKGRVVKIEAKYHDDDDDHSHAQGTPYAGEREYAGQGNLLVPNGVTTDDAGRVFVADRSLATDESRAGRIVRVKF